MLYLITFKTLVMENNQRNYQFHLRPCCMKELASLYEVKPRTIRNWLKPFEGSLGQKIGRYYTIRQLEIIFDKLGEPKNHL